MNNGHTILGKRYTDEIRNDFGTSSKMYNLRRKLYELNDSGLEQVHSALLGLLEAGFDIQKMRNLTEMRKYVDLKKSRGQLESVTDETVIFYHKLFVTRFGR